MNEADIVLTPIAQANGQLKNRPAFILRIMPPFDDFLVCGISTQLHQKVENFDEIIELTDSDFSKSGLVTDFINQTRISRCNSQEQNYRCNRKHLFGKTSKTFKQFNQLSNKKFQ